MNTSTNTNERVVSAHSLKNGHAQRHLFHTHFSLALTAVTCIGLMALSVAFRDNKTNKDDNHGLRWLNEDEQEEDYSVYSCNRLYSITPDRGEAQCQFAQNCNQGDGMWAPFVYCNHTLSFQAWMALLSPIVALWLVLLFRMLGSTAEDFFSPALEMFSVELGLPPRFAGVTLLALGNGAADVSATVSAITSDPQQGYLLSLGALTGAGMFISSVISAAVVLVAGGVPCRGALVRDVSALGVAVLIVWHELGNGVVGPETVTLFLSLYAVFVLLVLCADIYHRAVVLPRRAERAREVEQRRQLRQQQLHEQEIQHQQNKSNGGGQGPASPGPTDPMLHPVGSQPAQDPLEIQPPEQQQQQPSPHRPVRFSNVLTAFSNYDNDEDDNAGAEANDTGWWGQQSSQPQHAPPGVDSEELARDRPILLHGAHGILNTPQHHTPGTGAEAHANAMWTDENGGNSESNSNNNQDTAYAMLEDAGMLMDRTCGHDPSQPPPQSWKQAWTANQREMKQHMDEVWDDIAYNGDLDRVTKFLLICETPFLILRKATVPVPCQGYYVRPLVALSLAISPLWMVLYLWNSMDVDMLDVLSSPWFLSFWAVILLCAAAWMRYAPAGGGSDSSGLSLWVSTPVALYGFVVAATWIDTVADALVSLLDFLGTVLRIPGPVVGLTILAWGNSMADLSADITMARKGLANMAMTACFAGPFFNLLVGLGLGFSSLSAQTGQAEHDVQLQPSIAVGFGFLALNSAVLLITGLCLGTSNRIPKKYGYIAITLYSIYLIVSIALEYSKKGEEV